MNILYNFNPADASRPSFFEMFIQTQMMPSLKPAIKYMFSILSQRIPILNWCLKYMDELFYGALFIMEKHYLKYYDGSFSENFYGLKRCLTSVDGKSLPLKSSHKKWSLFFLVGVPYLKDKLDRYYKDKFGNGPVDSDLFRLPPMPQDSDQDRPLRRNVIFRVLLAVFKVVWPIFNACYESLFFIYQLLYMYNYTTYYTPFLHWQGLTVKRLLMQDLVEQSRKQFSYKMQRMRDNRERGIMHLVWGALVDGTSTMLDYSKYILPTGIFLFKFLEWWYSENQNLVTQQQPIPPAPEPPKKAQSGIDIPKDKKLCPICQKPRTNPAMAMSGFVYCYPCILNYTRSYRRCPITHLPTEPEQIRKLYDDNEIFNMDLLYSWGSAQSGRLGTGSRAHQLTPDVVDELSQSEVKVLALSCGLDHVLALVERE